MSRFQLDFSKLFASRNAQRRRARKNERAAREETQLFITGLEDRRVLSAGGVLAGLVSTVPGVSAASEVSANASTPAATAKASGDASAAMSSANSDVHGHGNAHVNQEQHADAVAELLGSVLTLPAGAAGNKHLLSLQSDQSHVEVQTPVAGVSTGSSAADGGKNSSSHGNGLSLGVANGQLVDAGLGVGGLGVGGLTVGVGVGGNQSSGGSLVSVGISGGGGNGAGGSGAGGNLGGTGNTGGDGGSGSTVVGVDIGAGASGTSSTVQVAVFTPGDGFTNASAVATNVSSTGLGLTSELISVTNVTVRAGDSPTALATASVTAAPRIVASNEAAAPAATPLVAGATFDVQADLSALVSNMAAGDLTAAQRLLERLLGALGRLDPDGADSLARLQLVLCLSAAVAAAVAGCELARRQLKRDDRHLAGEPPAEDVPQRDLPDPLVV